VAAASFTTGADASSRTTPETDDVDVGVGAESSDGTWAVVARGRFGAGSGVSTGCFASTSVGVGSVVAVAAGTAGAWPVPAVGSSSPTEVFAPPLALTFMSGTVGPLLGPSDPVVDVVDVVVVDVVVVDVVVVDGAGAVVLASVVVPADPEGEVFACEPAADPPTESDAPSSARATPAPPPVASATPTPSATARAPMRPTWRA
jgi:hypothetical protein